MLLGWLIAGCSDDGPGDPHNDASTGAGSVTAADAGGTDGTGAGADSDGGSAGGSGGAGDGTGGGGGPGTSCEVDRDCTVVNDCCRCAAVNVEQTIECGSPPCSVPLCGAITPAAACELGTCVIEWSCNALLVTCDVPPPECPEGHLPSTNADCYTGQCVPAEECDYVPDCSFCGPDEACIVTDSQIAPLYACKAMPPDCGGTPTCACLPDACDPGFDTCVDGRMGVTCSCPAC